MNLLPSSPTSGTTPVSENEISDAGPAQLDDAILRLSTILRRARNIKNSLSPINRFPPEILAYIAPFLPTERDLICSTAICQHWRTVLLSSPRLWCHPSGPPSKIRAYIERSKSTPINVRLPSPELAELIAPHASRLAGLTVQLNGESHGFSQVIEHLPHPIPTLHSLRVISDEPLDALEFPSDPKYTFCSHMKRLGIVGILGFRECQTFPNITEFTMHMSFPWTIERFLNILERFPVLERLFVTFHRRLSVDTNPKVVTLPHVQEMKISSFTDVEEAMQSSSILEYLQLPNLKSLSLQVPPKFVPPLPVFPIPSFGERFPTFAELPEVQVKLGTSVGEATFRSPSQATLEYITGPFASYLLYEHWAWIKFPLLSIRRLIVDVVSPPSDDEVMWLLGLWGDLRHLEDLEIGGECGRALDMLRDGSDPILSIQTLTLRHCGEYERVQALGLKRALDTAGRNVTLVCIPDPGAQEVTEAEVDIGGLGGE